MDYKETDTSLEYWLDEREYMSREDYKKGVFAPMILPIPRPFRIFLFVVFLFICMLGGVNG